MKPLHIDGQVQCARSIVSAVESELSRVGVLSRVFGRAKTSASIQRKMSVKGYSRESGRLMQDLIGARIALYFRDDLPHVQRLMEKRFDLVDSTIDTPSTNAFGPTRVNLVFRIPSDQQNTLVIASEAPIDTTFEVQIRTLFSEGWHEVEHDLRYKHPDDWRGHDEVSRTLNGILATLETCDWSMVQLFETLAHTHYKAQAWEAMLRNKFRLRFDNSILDHRIADTLTGDSATAKSVFRASRARLIEFLATLDTSIPITVSNAVWLVNHIEVKNESLTATTPFPITQALQ